LTAVLARQGHELVAWAPEPCRERIEAAGAAFRPQDPEMPEMEGFKPWVSELARVTEYWTKVLVSELFAEDVDLILHDSQVPWARIAGEYLGLPRVVSHPMYPIISPDEIRSKDARERPTIHPVEAEERFQASWLALARRWGVELEGWDSMIHSAQSSETVVAYTTEEMMGDWVLPPSWHCIGPLLDDPPPPPPPSRAASGERPLVYVCFGTSFNARAEQFQAVLDGLGDEPVDVLISTGAGSITAADLGPLPANVALRDFVPAREILARSAAHITHGGCNSVHETLLAGVPMLFMPQAYDQFPLAGHVEVLGAGRVVREDPDDIRAGLRWLIEDDAPRKRAQELGEHLANYDGERRVDEIFSRVLAENAAVTA
jgi:MGT family glycosyltransferase